MLPPQHEPQHEECTVNPFDTYKKLLDEFECGASPGTYEQVIEIAKAELHCLLYELQTNTGTEANFLQKTEKVRRQLGIILYSDNIEEYCEEKAISHTIGIIPLGNFVTTWRNRTLPIETQQHIIAYNKWQAVMSSVYDHENELYKYKDEIIAQFLSSKDKRRVSKVNPPIDESKLGFKFYYPIAYLLCQNNFESKEYDLEYNLAQYVDETIPIIYDALIAEQNYEQQYLLSERLKRLLLIDLDPSGIQALVFCDEEFLRCKMQVQVEISDKGYMSKSASMVNERALFWKAVKANLPSPNETMYPDTFTTSKRIFNEQTTFTQFVLKVYLDESCHTFQKMIDTMDITDPLFACYDGLLRQFTLARKNTLGIYGKIFCEDEITRLTFMYNHPPDQFIGDAKYKRNYFKYISAWEAIKRDYPDTPF